MKTSKRKQNYIFSVVSRTGFMLVLALFVAVSIFLHQDPLNAASKDSKYLALSKDVLVTTSATLL